MPISVTPVLSSTVGYLDDIRDQVAYLLRYFIMNPADVSEVVDTISMRKLAGMYQEDRDNMARQATVAFARTLSNKFPDYSFDVEFTAEDYEKKNDIRYTLRVSISISKTPFAIDVNKSAIISGAITVDPTTYDMSITLANDLDSSTL